MEKKIVKKNLAYNQVEISTKITVGELMVDKLLDELLASHFQAPYLKF